MSNRKLVARLIPRAKPPGEHVNRICNSYYYKNLSRKNIWDELFFLGFDEQDIDNILCQIDALEKSNLRVAVVWEAI